MTAIRKLIYFVAFAVAAVFVANVITISLGKASTSTVVETAINGIAIMFLAGDYLRHAVSGIPFPKANHGESRDDRLDTLDGQIGDLQSELNEANSKIEAQQEEISDLRSELESADSEVKETCRKIDEAIEGIDPGEPAPDFFVPKIYETSPDGKLVHAYDLPPEPDRKSALAAVAASIDARAKEGNPLHEPKAVIAKAYSAKTIEDSIG